jgi:DNA-binding MarR family transcriptional regulator
MSDASQNHLQERIIGLVRSDRIDISLRQLAILLICRTVNFDSRVRSVAARLQIPKPSVSRAADRLSEMGLLRRIPDPEDGRSVLLVTTKQGLLLCTQILSPMDLDHREQTQSRKSENAFTSTANRLVDSVPSMK